MNQTKERWQEIEGIVERSYDYMDANHWMHFHTALEENRPLDGDYKKAFQGIRKTVLDNYVHVTDGKDPALDPFEETYHLLVYFETEKDREVPFNRYLRAKQAELKEKRRHG